MTILAETYSRIGRKLSRTWQATGRNLQCSVCLSGVRQFLPLDATFRQQWTRNGFDLALDRFETLNLDAYLCPICGASDRDRLFALFLDEFAHSASKTGRSVEFAPSGPLTAVLHRRLPAWQHRTADLMMAHVDDKVDICDMRNQYADNTFDLFVCSHVLEHVSDDRVALAELFRILKPGGAGILMVPIHLDLAATRNVERHASEQRRWAYVAQGDHERLHAGEDFRALIRSAGFVLQQLGATHFSNGKLSRHGVSDRSVLYVGLKRSVG